MPEEKNPLHLVQDILTDTRETVDKLLESHDTIRIFIKTKFDLMINHIGFINGRQVQGLERKSPLSPLKEFMGEPIKIKEAKKITEEILTPDEQRKKEFADKVDKLAAAFADMTNEAILDSYKADQLVIRGVARKAGIEKYRPNEVNITTAFLDDIRTALSAQEVFNQNKLKIAKDLDENQDQ